MIEFLSQIFDLSNIDKQLGDNFWSPIEVAHINNCVLRAAAVKGEYHWHTHEEDDELFFVYKGQIVIDTEKGPITLQEGQGTVIQKGVSHKPRAENRAIILMIEPAKLKSKGD